MSSVLDYGRVKRMKEKLLKNWGLKIMAVLIAFLVWFLVANIEDYTITKTITGIPVELLNEDAITGQDMVYEIEQGKTVDVKVDGRRSVVEKLTPEDFVATADLSELSITNSVQIAVDAVDASVRKEIDISVVDSMMKVAIEERGEQKLPIGVITTGKTQDGYAVVSTATTPNMVTISGAASKVKNIKSVAVYVDVEGMNTSISTNGALELLDADGDIIDQDKLNLSLTTVTVNIDIKKTKEVPIQITPAGTVAEGYSIAGDIEYQPTTVLIAGEESVLRSIESIDINDIDVTDKNSDFETTVNIGDYLPEGVVVADKTQDVAVKINIEKLVEKTVTIQASDIKIKNGDSELDYTVQDDGTSYEIVVIGLKRDVDKLTASDIAPTVDVSEYQSEGVYSAQVTFKELENVRYQDEIHVTVDATKKASTTEAASTTEKSSTTTEKNSTTEKTTTEH